MATIGPTRAESIGFVASMLIVRVEDYMRQLPFRASVLVSQLRHVIGVVVTLLGPSWDGPVARYRPEDHYVRGPGPKWREKHGL